MKNSPLLDTPSCDYAYISGSANQYASTYSAPIMTELKITTDIGPQESAKIIDLLMTWLKAEYQIKVADAEAQLNWTKGLLSKLRNYESYKTARFQGRHRRDYLNELIHLYGIQIWKNESSDYVFSLSADSPVGNPSATTATDTNQLHFVYYYWTRTHHIGTCRVEINPDWTKARFWFYATSMGEYYAEREATIRTDRNLVYFHLLDDQKEIFSTIIFYTGNAKASDLDALLGTFAGARIYDSAPVCGKVILEKVADIAEAHEKIQHVSIPESCLTFLREGNLEVAPTTVYSLRHFDKLYPEDSDSL